MLEARLHMALDKLSNNEVASLNLDKEQVLAWIRDAADQWAASMERQIFREPEDFRIRMSNIGRPLCQLQMEKSGAKKSRMPYNHIVRMMHGDAIECIMEVVLRVAGLNITGGKNKVVLDLGDHQIKGEDDIHIDGKVYDTKSSSTWAFNHKWSEGYAGLRAKDEFGYVGQLVGYSKAQDKPEGGWIVVEKSTGQVRVVEAEITDGERQEILSSMKQTAASVDSDFKRCFEPEKETFRGKLTGSLRLPSQCSFCDFLGSCWPKAKHLPQTGSQAKEPRHYWYVQYDGEEL